MLDTGRLTITKQNGIIIHYILINILTTFTCNLNTHCMHAKKTSNAETALLFKNIILDYGQLIIYFWSWVTHCRVFDAAGKGNSAALPTGV